MAGAFWLSKVVVVLALLLRINCHAYTDDLLDRVRASKSNEPEVRDFLRSVLQHRSDFRWIHHAANKVNMDAEALLPPQRDSLSARAAATKNKRSFYLSERQRQRQQLEPSGYPVNYDTVYGDAGGELDERRKNARDAQRTSYHQHRHQHNRQHLHQQDNYADDVEFDGPVNDLYPYQDDLNAPQVPDDQQQRVARKSPQEANVMYDDVQQHHEDNDNDDFLDDFVAGSETDAKPDPILNINEELLSFVSDADDFNYDTDANENKRSRPKWFKRANSAEELLNEKLMLHSLLRKTAAENQNQNNNNNNKDTNSENVFQSRNTFKFEGGKGRRMLMNLPLPGNPIEVIPNSEKGVRFAPGQKYEKCADMAKTDLESEHLEGPPLKVVQRKCTDSLQEHDFSVPEMFSNGTQSKEFETPLSEFYYSQPHDVLGINQDVQTELRQSINTSKFKRALRWEDFKRGRGDSSKKQKSINIKIFDDNQLVKDVEKGNGQNSIVLTIKNERHAPIIAVGTTSTDSPLIVRKYLNDLQSNFLMRRDDDNTLQKIDRILKHDEASLKMHSFGNRRGITPGIGLVLRSVNPMAGMKVTNKKLLVSKTVPKSIRYVTPAFKQNRLEDQTEPTSAAEQRELGKINNKLNTMPGTVQSTSEKTYIIPLRKNKENWLSNLDRNQIDLVRSPDDREMAIRVMIDNKLKDSEDVLGKLRKELEQSLMRSLTTDDLRKSRELLTNMQKFRSTMIDNKEKRAIEADQDCNSNGIRGADAFRTRKLFEFKGTTRNDEDEKIVEGADSELTDHSDNKQKLAEQSEVKRDIRKMLGMHRDEDYAEDKADMYKTKKVRHAKGSKSEKAATHTTRMHTTTTATALIKSQQERVALKSRLARTRPIKVKKEINSANDEADEILEKIDHAEEQDKQKSIKEESLLQNEGTNDKLNKRANLQDYFLKYTFATDAHDQVNDDGLKMTVVTPHNERNAADRCCNNEPDDNSNNKQGSCKSNQDESMGSLNNKNEEHFKSNENVEAEASNNAGAQSNGNELDIIEKTQAILLHLTATTPPFNGKDGRGDIDENDDPGLKRTGDNHNDNIVVKHINSYKVTDDTQRPSDDMVAQIMELVQNYKSKIAQNNQANMGVPPTEQNVQAAENLDKKMKTHPKGNTKDNNQDDDLIPIADFDENNLTATETSFAHDETDSSLHGHVLEHGKKLHPKEEKKCDMPEGTDKEANEKCRHFMDHNQEEFIMPIAVKEGYIKPEVVADISDDRQGTVTEEPHEKMIKKTNKRDTRRQENPLAFTPDSIDSFKEVVEASKINIENEDSGVDLAQSEGQSEQRYKRDIDNNEYSEDEIEKLLQVNDDADENDLDKRRYRRYNYRSKSNYYNPFRRFPKQVTEARKIEKKKTKDENGASVVITSRPQRTCAHDIETFNRPTTAQSAAKKKKQRKSQNCHLFHEEIKDDNTFCGKKEPDTDASAIDPKLRERNRGKIYQQSMMEKRMEQERIKDVLNGHLMLSLMETFQTVLKHHARVQSRFGHKMSNKCIAEEVHLIEQNREDQTKADVRHAQLMLHQVIVMLNKIVAEQVHRRTCLTLSPTLKAYIKRMTNMKKTSTKSKAVAEGYPLPPVKAGGDKDVPMNEKQGDFLFQADKGNTPQSKNEQEAAMRRRIGMIRLLLKKYDNMSHNCQVKVDTVRDYLVQNLRTLQQLYKSKHFGEDDQCGVACLQPPTGSTDRGNQTTTMKPKEGESTGQSEGTTGSGGTTSSGGSSETSSESSATSSPSGEATASTTESGASTAGSTVTAKAVRSIYDDAGRYNNEAGMFGSNEYIPYKIEEQPKSVSDSEKYKKLVDAAATYRRKRQIEQRLARLFGHGKYVTELTTQHSDNFDVEELNNIAYEAPLIYAMH